MYDDRLVDILVNLDVSKTVLFIRKDFRPLPVTVCVITLRGALLESLLETV
jgi:hypothetical protein